MLRLRVALVLLVFALALPCTAQGVVIKTNWIEIKRDYSNRNAFMRFYVRKIEVTRTSWKAWVGVTNATTKVLEVRNEQVPAGSCCPAPPFSYWSGPSLQWYRVFPAWPTNPVEVAKKASVVRPSYPESLGPRKSWFGVFSGSLDGVPRDRFLHVGFGRFVHNAYSQGSRRDFGHFSTSHGFKLPRVR